MVSTVESAAALPQSGEVVGLIRPPPDIRAIVEKTAQFVARNGKSFESRILSSAEGQSAKFGFMKAGHAYHAYYEFKIRECEENGGELVQDKEKEPEFSRQETTHKNDNNNNQEQNVVIATSAESTVMPLARFLPNREDGTDEVMKLSVMDNSRTAPVSALENEIIRLTAQYTAAGGRSFLAGLAQREQRNPQFDFLKPTHMLFSYFTSLVDAYTKLLAPSTELSQELKNCSDWQYCLRRIAMRWDTSRRANENERREKARQEAERVAFQAVDWHDFVVVEVIDFPSHELQGGEPILNKEDQDSVPVQTEQNQSLSLESSTTAENIRIVSNYAPRIASGTSHKPSDVVVDPLTGQEVAIDRMTEHMRIQLLDPKWREEQRRQAASNQAQIARDEQIADSLASFAKQRNDIFGSSQDEEATILQQQQSSKRKQIDSSNLTSNQQQQTNIHTKLMNTRYEQQFASVPPGLGYDNPQPPLAMPPPPPPPPTNLIPPVHQFLPQPPQTALPPHPPPGPPHDLQQTNAHKLPPIFTDILEPEPKRLKVDPETGLVPESDFITHHGGPDTTITITVKLPVDDTNPAWQLKGQTVDLVCSISRNIRYVKRQLSSLHLGNMPPSKQQLKNSKFGFLKDTLSLAHFNFTDNTQLDLVVRAPGRR